MTDSATFNEWINSRNNNLKSPTSFLSVTGMYWLTETPQRIDGLTGEFSAVDHTVTVANSSTGDQTFTLEPRAELTFDLDGIKVELASRAGQIIVRPRDPKNPMFDAFEGISTWAFDPAFVVQATLEAFDEPRDVVVDSIVEGHKMSSVSPGELVFELGGKQNRLTSFAREGSQDLSIYFRDETSGKEAYGTGRSVAALHNADGSYTINFNQAGNFPCAYTDFATCPIPPRENHLSIAINAGERMPALRNTFEGISAQH
jgi:uncharacterized protein (DUF1684 family)